jgi:hypothetical protein
MCFLIKKSHTQLANQITSKPSEFSSEFQLTTPYIPLFSKKRSADFEGAWYDPG